MTWPFEPYEVDRDEAAERAPAPSPQVSLWNSTMTGARVADSDVESEYRDKRRRQDAALLPVVVPDDPGEHFGEAEEDERDTPVMPIEAIVATWTAEEARGELAELIATAPEDVRWELDDPVYLGGKDRALAKADWCESIAPSRDVKRRELYLRAATLFRAIAPSLPDVAPPEEPLPPPDAAIRASERRAEGTYRRRRRG